jgi:hypothetical protein
MKMTEEQFMKWILAIATLALATLSLEDRGREVASDARIAAGQAVDQARQATILAAGLLGFVAAQLVPRR